MSDEKIVPKTNKKGTYWYQYTHSECVLCWKGGDTKIRIYDRPKPKDVFERHLFEQYACDGHFM